MNPRGSDARASARSTSSCTRGSYERICSVINVEHGSLRTLEQDALAVIHGIVQQLCRVADHRPDASGELQILIADGRIVDLFLNLERVRQQLLVLGECVVQIFEALAVV